MLQTWLNKACIVNPAQFNFFYPQVSSVSSPEIFKYFPIRSQLHFTGFFSTTLLQFAQTTASILKESENICTAWNQVILHPSTLVVMAEAILLPTNSMETAYGPWSTFKDLWYSNFRWNSSSNKPPGQKPCFTFQLPTNRHQKHSPQKQCQITDELQRWAIKGGECSSVKS